MTPTLDAQNNMDSSVSLTTPLPPGLQQEIASKDYHFGNKLLKSGDILAWGIANKDVADFMRQQMPSPMQDWPQAIADFQGRIERHFGYAVYVSQISKNITTNQLRKIFEPFGNIKNFNHTCRLGMRNPWAFVTYYTAAAAERAAEELNGTVLEQETISVVRAEPGRDVVGEKLASETIGKDEPDLPQEPESYKLIEGLEDITDKVGAASISTSQPAMIDGAYSLSIDDATTLSISTTPSPLIKDLESKTTNTTTAVVVASTPPTDRATITNEPLAQPVEQDRLTNDIIALGSDLLEITRGIWADRHIYEAASMHDVVQLMARSQAVREAVRKLLANEALVYRAL